MIHIQELKRWLNTLPPEAGISIDDGGLTLVCDEDPDAYLEVGGIPEIEEEDEFHAPPGSTRHSCKHCGEPVSRRRGGGRWVHNDVDGDPEDEDYGWIACSGAPGCNAFPVDREEWLEQQEVERLKDEKRGTYPGKQDIAN